MSDARDVIARALFEIKGLGARYNLTIEQADAIIAAFTAAGYEIVQRDAPIQKPEPIPPLDDDEPLDIVRRMFTAFPPTPGPFNSFGKQDGE